MVSPPSRRRVLRAAGGAAATALAGCLFGAGCPRSLSLSLEPTADAEIVEENARDPAELDRPIARELVRTANEKGSATTWTVEGPSVHRMGFLGVNEGYYGYLELDDGYYDVTVETVGEATAAGHVFVLRDEEGANGQDPPGDAIPVAELPSHDRRAFLSGFGYRPGRKSAEGVTATIAYPERSLVEDSVLVPEPEYEHVRYRDRHFRLEKTGTGQVTVRTHVVQLERVGDSPAAFAAYVRDEHGVVLRRSELSAEQREVLDEAVEDGYEECAEYASATRKLVERLRDPDYARDDGTW